MVCIESLQAQQDADAAVANEVAAQAVHECLYDLLQVLDVPGLLPADHLLAQRPKEEVKSIQVHSSSVKSGYK